LKIGPLVITARECGEVMFSVPSVYVSTEIFTSRVTDKWNNLPQCCINCTTLMNNFESHIYKVLELKTIIIIIYLF